MNFFLAVGAIVVVALIVAALMDYRRRKLGDAKSGRETRRSALSQKANVRKRGQGWGAGQGGTGGGWGNQETEPSRLRGRSS
jgi:hypothetical protein